MMAYKPHSGHKTTVENIKKKFEAVPSSDLNGPPTKHFPLQNGKQSHPISSNSYSSRGKSSSVAQVSGSPAEVCVSSTELVKCPVQKAFRTERPISCGSNKGNIRRSPAFRCDKTVRGHNTIVQSSQSVVTNRVRMFEDEQCNEKIRRRKFETGIKDRIVKVYEPSFEKQGVLVNRKFIHDTKEGVTNIKPEIIWSGIEKSVPTSLVCDITESNGKMIKDEPHGTHVTCTRYASVIKRMKQVDGCVEDSFVMKDVCHVGGNEETLQICQTHSCICKTSEVNQQGICTQNNNMKISDSLQVDTNVLSMEGQELASNEMKHDSTVLTNTLKAALKAPLPSGPPPKKPPRTFAHGFVSPNVHSAIQKKIQSLQSVPVVTKKDISLVDVAQVSPVKVEDMKPKPVRSKTEPHIMLKKLETVLLKHQQGLDGVVLKPRTPLLNNRKEINVNDILSGGNPLIGKFGRTGPLPSLPSDKNISDFLKMDSKPSLEKSDNVALLGSCLDSLSCVSARDPSYIQGHFYEKLAEKQSEFFVDILKSRSNTFDEQCTKDSVLSKTSQKSVNEEHIYAEPYAFLSDGDKGERLSKSKALFTQSHRGKSGDGDKMHLEQLQEKKRETLHYLCTPITVDPLDRLDALTSFNHKVSEINNEPLNFDGPLLNIKSENVNKNDSAFYAVESTNEEKISAKKAPFLRLTSLVKSLQSQTSSDTVNKLDRSKIQQFMNQAFGSPLQVMPITPIDGMSSDCESLASSPDETYPPVFGSEDEGQHNNDGISRGSSKTTCSDDTASIASLEQHHQELSKLTEQRKVYVRRVSSRIFSTSQRPSSSDTFPHLFHCIMLVGLNLDCEKKVKVPYIKTIYPPHVAVPPLIEHLCFPDAADWPLANDTSESAKSDEQSYSLVITNEAGERKFGYCRRVMPEGASMCLPLAYCIISPFRAKGFYFKILLELESRHGQQDWLQTAFIHQLYACEFPGPGQGLRLPSGYHGSNMISHGGQFESLFSGITGHLRRPQDARLEERDLTQLFSTLPVPVLLQVFGSLLLERKVLFVSKSLSKLSSCIEALESILYPFSWQYTFIPVLPSTKLGICEAPTPYIIGILKGKDGKKTSVAIEDGIMVDLEESKILQSMGDESTILPTHLKRGLKTALQLVATSTEDNESSRNVLVSEAFIRMFVELCGHYATYIVIQQDGKKVFERESFIKAVSSRSAQLFLEWFTETAMFSAFIEARLKDAPDIKGVFEQRALEHSEEIDKNKVLLRNCKAINKKVKTIGDRIKDWTPFT